MTDLMMKQVITETEVVRERRHYFVASEGSQLDYWVLVKFGCRALGSHSLTASAHSTENQ